MPVLSCRQMDNTCANMHGYLTKAASAQVYFRHREAAGRVFAESLNLHVMMWSVGETVAVLVVGLGQVLVLRSFFSGTGPRRASPNGMVST